MANVPRNLSWISLWPVLAVAAFAQPTDPITPEQLKEEAIIFTPPGFRKIGEAKWSGTVKGVAEGRTGQLDLVVRDAGTGQLLPCRVNVVGRDGNFYHPASNRLSYFALTGTWSHTANNGGNRVGKAPYRYLGRFFYTLGETSLRAPEGSARVEVWRGYEYRPETIEVEVPPGGVKRVEIKLTRAVPMAAAGYYAGDTHLHLLRMKDENEQVFFDMLDLEDFRYGVNMAWNQVPTPLYAGVMDTLVDPQRALGRGSIRARGDAHMISGQEYRTKLYGHLNLSLRDDLAVSGKPPFSTDTWPVLGEIARETIDRGGFAFMAHGGYEQELYADAALGNSSGLELLQFGVYRHIGLENWYNMLNSGYRFAAHGASDYPGTRYLADCRTYVYHSTPPTMPEWLAGVAAGRSFFTNGPLLLLEVDGEKPGAQIRKQGTGPHSVKARVRIRCEVTPVTDIDLIVNGRTVKTVKVPSAESKGRWIEFDETVTVGESLWIAARAHSKSPGGEPDAEAHTNAVYVYLNARAPFQKAAIDAWIAKIDAQIAVHAKRQFADNARVLNYFQQARDVLLKIRAEGGLKADVEPARLAAELNVAAPGLRNLGLEASITDATDAEMKAYLDFHPPNRKPEETIKLFETVGGFRMELVAAEPLIRSPIAAAFDEDGNLYVGEMTDYPYNPYGPVRVSWQKQIKPGEKPIGSIRLLRDTDGDGRYDTSTVFADELLWAGGIVPWKGGVYVTAPPDIWYLKDTDGDGKADIRQKVFTGFGLDRQQGFINSLQFGLDHQIYASVNGNGGDIRPGHNPMAEPIIVTGRDLSFTPDSHRLELQTGSHQFGLSFDDWGNRFLCDQGNPAFHVVLLLRYLQRNPYFTPRATIFNTTPGSAPLFRISPVERWRLVKSGRRFAGTHRQADIAVIAAGRYQGAGTALAASGAGVSQFVVDATAGVTIYRGGAYPPEYYGSVFVGDSLANAVHRRVLVPAGATFKTERADPNTEFVRTSDNWFHPVNFVNAPDGTLYCIDMAREYSETANIPPDVEKHMDLMSGKDRGRIYRMAPPGFRQPAPPRLSRASTADLVAALASPHGWWRDTAHRLLFERQDTSAVSALERLVRESDSAPARVNALWSLQGLAALNDAAIMAGLGDKHPGVRENAVRLAEARLDASQELREKVMGLVSDPAPRVRLQVAFAVGESHQWSQTALLTQLARENLADAWIQSAIISSAADCGGELFAAVADASVVSNVKGVDFLRQLATVIGFQNRSVAVSRGLETLATLQNQAAAFQILSALGEGLKLAGVTLATVDSACRMRILLEQAVAIVPDASRSEATRRAAIDVLALVPYAQASPPLLVLLGPKQPAPLQLAALAVLAQFKQPQAGAALLKHFPDLTPAARTRAIDALLERPEHIELLLDAVKNKTVPRELSAKHMMALRQHGDERVRNRTNEVFGVANTAKRKDIYTAYLPALDLTGVPSRGKPIFESRCSICHRFAGMGVEFGPELTGVSSGGKEKLLSSILDPNRDVAPQYFFHTVVTKSGENTAGVMKNDTANAVTLVQPGGVVKTISRANIAQMKTQMQSLMPEGLESGLNHQDMADLIEFLFNPPR